MATTTTNPPSPPGPQTIGSAALPVCCPPFDPGEWEDRDVRWHDRLFVKEHVRCALHVPIGFGRAVTRAMAKIERAGASPAHPLMLTDETSAWGTDLYIDVTRPVPGAEMATLSGRFLTRVYDGPFRDAGAWIRDARRHATALGHRVDKTYLAYTACPRCAKARGHNYVVVFARIADA
jgi:hypothetical protein